MEEQMKEMESLDQGKKPQDCQGLVQQWNEIHVSENKPCSLAAMQKKSQSLTDARNKHWKNQTPFLEEAGVYA